MGAGARAAAVMVAAVMEVAVGLVVVKGAPVRGQVA